MDFKKIIARALRVTLVPSVEWGIIAKEKTTLKELFYKYALILIIFSAIGRTIGVFFFFYPVYGFSLQTFLGIIVNFVLWIFMPTLIIFVSTYLLHFFINKFYNKFSIVQSCKLITYSLTPLLLFSFIVFIHPILQIIIPIGLIVFIFYTVFQLWYGVKALFDIENNIKIKYYLIVIAVFFVIFIILQLLVTYILKLIFPQLYLFNF